MSEEMVVLLFGVVFASARREEATCDIWMERILMPCEMIMITLVLASLFSLHEL